MAAELRARVGARQSELEAALRRMAERLPGRRADALEGAMLATVDIPRATDAGTCVGTRAPSRRGSSRRSKSACARCSSRTDRRNLTQIFRRWNRAGAAALVQAAS